MLRKQYYLLLLGLTPLLGAFSAWGNCHQVCILVHGTWATNADWHQPGGEFYEMLKAQLAMEEIALVDFNWCGALSHTQRQKAAIRLAELIKSYPPWVQFILVTHSHGGNVGILASQILKRAGCINAFFALGTPIEPEIYHPNLAIINSFYNLFSFGDLYQTVLGFHKRTLPFMPGIYNISIEINDARPQHEQLHNETIAKWLLQLPAAIKKSKADGSQPLLAKFSQYLPPELGIDLDFDLKTQYDCYINKVIRKKLLRKHMFIPQY